MGKLIDADICLEKAWQNFHKQEDEHEKNIDDYDILRDRFYEQSGFECCQQTIVNEQPVEAILKADYENRLKADLKAILVELQLEIEEKEQYYQDKFLESKNAVHDTAMCGRMFGCGECKDLIQEKLDKLKGDEG